MRQHSCFAIKTQLLHQLDDPVLKSVAQTMYLIFYRPIIVLFFFWHVKYFNIVSDELIANCVQSNQRL